MQDVGRNGNLRHRDPLFHPARQQSAEKGELVQGGLSTSRPIPAPRPFSLLSCLQVGSAKVNCSVCSSSSHTAKPQTILLGLEMTRATKPSPRVVAYSSRTTVHPLAWLALRPLQPAHTYPPSSISADPLPLHLKATLTTSPPFLTIRRYSVSVSGMCLPCVVASAAGI